MSKILSLKNLACQYKGASKPVLFVKELSIHSGEMVFFIGPSGVGKSTILETLGLMSDTITRAKRDNSELILQDENQKQFSYYDLWNKKEKDISRFRHKNFSFIFQSTNLFESLSAIENVYLPTLFKKNDRSDSIKRTRMVIRDIFPGDSEVILSKNPKITEISGGQRQRLAFCRAVAHDFKILFADEPTGNLDVANSQNLMHSLKANLEQRKGTAIIVSHDIQLAMNFASKIVLITREQADIDRETITVNKDKIGIIQLKNTFVQDASNNWYSLENPEIKIEFETLKQYLVSKFN